MRDRSIDYAKGFLVALMVLCHILQFFGKATAYPEQEWIMNAVNAVAFPGFVFFYGRSVYAAYFTRTWREVWPRMLKSALRVYGAYLLSGVGYLVLKEGNAFNFYAVRNVAVLRSVPGWSEFLVSFALYGLLACALFVPLKRLMKHRAALCAVCIAGFAASFLPYGLVKNGYAALFIGGNGFTYFPVLQYLPFFLSGMAVSAYGMRRVPMWIAGCAAATGAAVGVSILYGLPERFPPSLWWLLLPCLPIVLAQLGGQALDGFARTHSIIGTISAFLSSMGRNSLFYLLVSNLVIFCASGTGKLPAFRRSSPFPFCLRTGSTAWALFWTAALLCAIGFLSVLCAGKKKK